MKVWLLIALCILLVVMVADCGKKKKEEENEVSVPGEENKKNKGKDKNKDKGKDKSKDSSEDKDEDTDEGTVIKLNKDNDKNKDKNKDKGKDIENDKEKDKDKDKNKDKDKVKEKDKEKDKDKGKGKDKNKDKDKGKDKSKKDKDKSKDKGDKSDKMSKNEKKTCEKEEKNIIKCVKDGTYILDMAKYSFKEDLISEMQKSKDYKKVIESEVQNVSDNIIEDYMNSAEFEKHMKGIIEEFNSTTEAKELVEKTVEDTLLEETKQIETRLENDLIKITDVVYETLTTFQDFAKKLLIRSNEVQGLYRTVKSSDFDEPYTTTEPYFTSHTMTVPYRPVDPFDNISDNVLYSPSINPLPYVFYGGEEGYDEIDPGYGGGGGYGGNSGSGSYGHHGYNDGYENYGGYESYGYYGHPDGGGGYRTYAYSDYGGYGHPDGGGGYRAYGDYGGYGHTDDGGGFRAYGDSYYQDPGPYNLDPSSFYNEEFDWNSYYNQDSSLARKSEVSDWSNYYKKANYYRDRKYYGYYNKDGGYNGELKDPRFHDDLPAWPGTSSPNEFIAPTVKMGYVNKYGANPPPNTLYEENSHQYGALPPMETVGPPPNNFFGGKKKANRIKIETSQQNKFSGSKKKTGGIIMENRNQYDDIPPKDFSGGIQMVDVNQYDAQPPNDFSGKIKMENVNQFGAPLSNKFVLVNEEQSSLDPKEENNIPDLVNKKKPLPSRNLNGGKAKNNVISKSDIMNKKSPIIDENDFFQRLKNDVQKQESDVPKVQEKPKISEMINSKVLGRS